LPWAAIVLGVTAFALCGCGRKAGLDAPPNAFSAAADSKPADTPAQTSNVFGPSFGEAHQPAAAPKAKTNRPFVLDSLLD